MRLVATDVAKRIDVSLDKTIKKDNQKGIMKFGSNNDYPQVIERIVLGSITGKSCRNIYAKFLIGKGFENQQINDIIIGYDERGKRIRLRDLLRLTANSLALFNGVFIHMDRNLLGEMANPSVIPFKDCRFANTDDRGYTAKVAVYDNWTKDNKTKFDKNKIQWYPVFSNDLKVIQTQIKSVGKDDYTGQVFFEFFDDEYLYPLSPFDSVYLDCDTEHQVAIYKNNMTRNGMTNKTIMRIAEPSNEDDKDDLEDEIKNWEGTDGTNTLVLYDDIDPETGEIKKTGAFAVDTIESNIDDKLFETWQKGLSDNIRKAVRSVPQTLIDIEESKLGTTSGDALIQATEFYNQMTLDDRENVSDLFKELFEKSNIKELRENRNWNIIPLKLYKAPENGNNTIVE